MANKAQRQELLKKNTRELMSAVLLDILGFQQPPCHEQDQIFRTMKKAVSDLLAVHKDLLQSK